MKTFRSSAFSEVLRSHPPSSTSSRPLPCVGLWSPASLNGSLRRIDTNLPEARTTREYLRLIGVPELPPRTSPFDPGYDPVTFAAHLEQSSHLISIVKISMACWIIANEASTREKVAAAKKVGVPTVTGGGPFEVAVAQGQLGAYLDLCAELGFTRIECGEGFTEMTLPPNEVVEEASRRALDVQFELGKKHGGAFGAETVEGLIEQGKKWLAAGAKQLVVEARESADEVGLFAGGGDLNRALADRLAEAFGLDTVVFEAPNKPSQFAFLSHFGPEVHLCNVRLEELLRVEIYRRGLHSDAFEQEKLRPRLPTPARPGTAPRAASAIQASSEPPST
jgi:phosphosulfolactate synthase